MRQATIVEVEVGVEEGRDSAPREMPAGLDPLTGLHLAGVRDQPGVELADDFGMLVGDVGLLFGVTGKVVSSVFPGKVAMRTSFQSPLRIAPGSPRR